MLNAVWVAVIIAAACWAVLVAAAVYVLIKLSRLITQTSAAVSGLREDSDAVIARAHATIDATAGQLNRTDEITASMDQVASGMAELTGRVTALAPLARLGHGKGYAYPHDYAEGVVTQQYAPDSLASRTYYEPSRHGAEARYAERSERIKVILGRAQPDGQSQPDGQGPEGQGPDAQRPGGHG